MKKNKPILLVGLGAIGSIIFSRLTRNYYQVVGLTSKTGTDKIREKGLRVKLIEDLNPQLHECEVYDILPEKYVFDTCIVTTKSWINEQVIDELFSHLSDNASILLFQNGLKVEDPFLRKSKKWKIFRAITSIAAARNEKNGAIEINTGFTKVGRINDKTSRSNIWISLLTAVGIPVTASKNINREIWLKAIVNCSICPLGAITRLKNGEILADLFLNSLMKKVVEEILMILPENISIDFDEAFELIEQIIQQSANHKCSMLQDVENGRKTEIDSLNGAIVVIAASQEVKVPLNFQLTEIVKKLTEEKYPKELAILDLRKLS